MFNKWDMERIEIYRKDIFEFIYDMWGLEPQWPNTKNGKKWKEALRTNDSKRLKLSNFKKFMMGRHITWQQTMILNAVNKAMNWKADKKISVRSWHGIGKSMITSIIVIWALFCFEESQVPCTAPTRDQLWDILRPEIKMWINRMPKGYKELFDITGDYVRIVGWDKRFARARTGRKENPEALAGVHSNSMVCLVADEASWIEDIVFAKSVGALTSPQWLMILISNPTRTTWTFYRSQNERDNGWQKLAFNSLESPIVNEEFVESQAKEYWLDSDDYKITVLGEFPDTDWIDEQGWMRLIKDEDINMTTDGNIKPDKLGVDPAGDGIDEGIMVGRNLFKAKILSIVKKSNAKKDAGMVNTLMTEHMMFDHQIYIDNFWVGANVSQELGLLGHRVNAINVWEVKRTRNKKRFVNPRAEMYRNMREWILNWGLLVNNKRRKDLDMIYYRRNTAWKIEIMGKKDMKKKFGKSPDAIDSLAMTFLSNDKVFYKEENWEGNDFSVDYSDYL